MYMQFFFTVSYEKYRLRLSVDEVSMHFHCKKNKNIPIKGLFHYAHTYIEVFYTSIWSYSQLEILNYPHICQNCKQHLVKQK